ncbi:TonB-dependent receptor [Salinivirga cyanobacteriivorans]
MKINSLLLIFALLLISIPVCAQTNISGTITDRESGTPLSMVNIFLPELNKGTQSNEEGFFTLKELPAGKVKVQFSFVGYKTQMKTITTNEGNKKIDIAMQPTVIKADEVVISGGTHSTQHQNAIKIELIKAKKLETGATPSFTETITQVPGVEMISKGPGVTKPVIRGLSMTNILMLNNGVKLENFQFSENHPFLADEFGTDRIEIIKGPASILYGSDAVGGVINVLKEKPAPINRIQADFNTQFHSNTSGIVSNVGIKGSEKKYFWMVRAGQKSHTDYTDGNNNRIYNTRFNEQSLKTGVGFNNNLGLFKLYYDYNSPKLGMSVPAAENLVNTNGRKNEFWYQNLTSHLISSKNTIFAGNYKMDMNAALQMNNRKLQTDSTTPQNKMVDMQLNTFSYDIKTHFPSSENSDYILGIQGALKTNRNGDAPNHVIPDATVNDLAALGLIRYTFFKKLKVQAGARFDYRYIETQAEPNKPSVKSEFGDYSASLGATYQVKPTLLLRANMASGYRTPNIAELTQNGVHGNRFERGNPNLESQRSYEGDLSAHWHNDFLMIDIAGFYHKIYDYIYMAPTNDSTANDLRIYQYNQANATLYGGEANLEISPWRWFDITSSYAYLEGKQDDGAYLPFIPQNKWRFALQFHPVLPKPLLPTSLKVENVLAMDQNNPARFETATEGYFLVNVKLSSGLKWKNQKIYFSLNVHNLLNETYIDHLSTLKPLGLNNMGRNISLQIKIPVGIK